MTFSNTLMQLSGEDFLREFTEFMLNHIFETDVTYRINAEPHERCQDRRNNHLFIADIFLPGCKSSTMSLYYADVTH